MIHLWRHSCHDRDWQHMLQGMLWHLHTLGIGLRAPHSALLSLWDRNHWIANKTTATCSPVSLYKGVPPESTEWLASTPFTTPGSTTWANWCANWPWPPGLPPLSTSTVTWSTWSPRPWPTMWSTIRLSLLPLNVWCLQHIRHPFQLLHFHYNPYHLKIGSDCETGLISSTGKSVPEPKIQFCEICNLISEPYIRLSGFLVQLSIWIPVLNGFSKKKKIKHPYSFGMKKKLEKNYILDS